MAQDNTQLPLVLSHFQKVFAPRKVTRVTTKIENNSNTSSFSFLTVYFEKEESLDVVLKKTTSQDIWIKEIGTYGILIPTLNEYALKQTNQASTSVSTSTSTSTGLLSMFPKYYEAEVGVGLFLENLAPLGFRCVPASSQLDLLHLRLLLPKVATFHATSFAFKTTQPQQTLRDTFPEILREVYTMWRVPVLAWFDIGLDHTLSFLKQHQFEQQRIELLTYLKTNINSIWDVLLQPKEPLAAIGHGDLWTSNLMFKYDQFNQPVDVKIIDLQAFRRGNPGLDLSNLFCICVDGQLLCDSFPELMQLYHHHFIQTLDQLDCSHSIARPSLDDLLVDFKDFCGWGFIAACQWLPVMLTKQRAGSPIDEQLKNHSNRTEEEITNLKRRLDNLFQFNEKNNFLSIPK